ncbi:hypothetical protein MUN82_02065 [Hymenobacter aerilatus]|uniref:Uncharacterized protein n=1 Tax=Hymenobacter aerilatus TaxID=2932251 RepID=A0A8T9T1C5_9BACT|nr:hypothetical protein [Hymenobacter aerilatus]UOR05896.1 hypothetical protein MUN82_02065 [Hymenobacter aerilatus]
MAQTEKGLKFIRVPAYTRSYHGKTITVPAHVRSTPTHCPTTEKVRVGEKQ